LINGGYSGLAAGAFAVDFFEELFAQADGSGGDLDEFIVLNVAQKLEVSSK
jgi:hypothetical protein